MKKEFLSRLLTVSILISNAHLCISQNSTTNLNFSQNHVLSTESYPKQTKTNSTGWLLPSDIAMNINYGNYDFYTPYVQYLWPDSCAVTVSSNGTKSRPWMHSVGYTFDARSIGFDEFLEEAPITGIYKVDSIAIGALYEYRNNKFDTLLIEIGAVNIDDLISLKPLQMGSSDTTLYPLKTNSTGTQQYGVGTNWNNPNKLIFKYVLTQNDTTNQYLKFIKIPLPSHITVEMGQVIGANITFIPGTQYQMGDTIKVSGGQTPKKLNSFGIYYMKANQASGAAFFDPYGKNLFNYNEKRTRYQTWTSSPILNQCLYPDVWGSTYFSFRVTPIITHSINYSVVNGNGLITASVNGLPINSGDNIPAGQSIVFTANPNVDYVVREWKLNGVVVSGNTSNTYSINNILSSANVTVEFRLQNSSLLTFDVNGGNGTISASVDGSNTPTNNYIENGKDITFNAIPANGYRVKNWKLNNSIVQGNTSTLYVLNNIQQTSNVRVEYEQITHMVTFSVIGGNGSLAASYNSSIISNNSQIPQGANIQFNANPLSNYHVKEWKLNDVVVFGNTSNIFIVNNLQSDIVVTIEYEETIYNYYNVSYSVYGGNGNLSAIVDGTYISPGSSVQANKDVVFTAMPNNNFVVKEWKLNNAAISGNTGNSFTLINLQEHSTVSVEFKPNDIRIDENGNSSIVIYPNPFVNIFYILSSNIYKMEVLNIQGKVVVEKLIESGLNELDMSAHQAGVYIIKLSNNDERQIFKINKLRD